MAGRASSGWQESHMSNLTFTLYEDEHDRRKRKTNVWGVSNALTNDALGEIKWHAPWRRYCFFPAGMLCADVGCLLEISNFMSRAMLDRKQFPKPVEEEADSFGRKRP